MHSPLIWLDILFCLSNITKSRLYNFDPLKPHFYIVNWGLQEYTLFFLFLLKNIDCGYSLERSHRGGSNGYPQSMFRAEMRKISVFFNLIFFQFLEVKFSIYLNRRVFVMKLPQEQYYIDADNKGSGETALMRRLV